MAEAPSGRAASPQERTVATGSVVLVAGRAGGGGVAQRAQGPPALVLLKIEWNVRLDTLKPELHPLQIPSIDCEPVPRLALAVLLSWEDMEFDGLARRLQGSHRFSLGQELRIRYLEQQWRHDSVRIEGER